MLRVAEKAFQRLLRDDACLSVEVPFEHLPGDVKLRVEHARHGLEEIVRLRRGTDEGKASVRVFVPSDRMVLFGVESDGGSEAIDARARSTHLSLAHAGEVEGSTIRGSGEAGPHLS